MELIKFSVNSASTLASEKHLLNNSISEKPELKENSSIALANPSIEISIENVLIND